MLKKYSKDQLLVLVGACLAQCALLGILVNCVSVLLGAVSSDLAMDMTRVSAYHTLKSIASAVSATFLTALYFRMNKGAYMALCIGGIVAGHLLLVAGAGSWLWWASAILIGLAYSTCGICVPYILGLWFPQNAGFATGIALAFSGIGGVLFNPIASRLITAFGWRAAIIVMSVITAAIAVPGVLLAFGKKPPAPAYDGTAEVGKITVSAGRPDLAKKIFPLWQIALVCGTIVVMFNNYISSYATDLGYTLEVGATLASLVMVGNVLGKLIFGAACDRFGVWISTQVNFVILAVAMACYLFMSDMIPALYLASLLFGSVYGINMIAISRGCIAAYGDEGAQKYMGLHTGIGSGLGAVCSFLVGPLYDATGSFNSLLAINLALLAISFLVVYPIRKMLKD